MRLIKERGRFNLVTGATGFVGGHLVNHLLATGEPVRVLLHKAESAQQFRHLGTEVVVGDVCDRLALDRALKWSKAVYHCAAASDFASDDEIRRTNLNGVRNVLHSARMAECGRVVLVSSLNVSKAVREETINEEAPITRTWRPSTTHRYDWPVMPFDEIENPVGHSAVTTGGFSEVPAARR